MHKEAANGARCQDALRARCILRAMRSDLQFDENNVKLEGMSFRSSNEPVCPSSSVVLKLGCLELNAALLTLLVLQTWYSRKWFLSFFLYQTGHDAGVGGDKDNVNNFTTFSTIKVAYNL